jgi:hypothetical protein
VNTTSLNAPRLSAGATGRPAAPGFWARFGSRLWLALEAQGHRRAQAELRRLANHHVFSDPAMAQRLNAVADQSQAQHQARHPG